MVLTYKQQYNLKYKQPKNKSNSLIEIAKKTGIKKSILQKIYNRGVGAFKGNRKSVRPHVTSAEQWAMARVYASINPKPRAS